MSRKDRPSRKNRPGKRVQRPVRPSRGRSPSGLGWHTYKASGVTIYVNPNVSTSVAHEAFETLVDEHTLAASSRKSSMFEIQPGLFGTAHRFRGEDWYVVTDVQLLKMYIATADVFRSRFGWSFATPDH